MRAEKLRQLADRIGAMSLRERVFVFAAALVAVLAAMQWLLIDPASLRAQQARDRLQVAEDGLAEIARQQLPQGAARDPDAALRTQLAALETRLGKLNAELEARERTLVPPERMRDVLRDLVQGPGGLRIVGFKSLPAQPVALADAAEGAPPGFYRHGVEITVSGRYADLVAYLERLERLPWRLRWSAAKLDAGGRPELTLTLTVHTLSLEEAWLSV